MDCSLTGSMLQIYTQRRTAKGQWPQPRGAVIMAPGGIERLGSVEDRGHNSKTEPPYYVPPGQTRIQVTSDFCPLTSSNPQSLPFLSDPPHRITLQSAPLKNSARPEFILRGSCDYWEETSHLLGCQCRESLRMLS